MVCHQFSSDEKVSPKHLLFFLYVEIYHSGLAMRMVYHPFSSNEMVYLLIFQVFQYEPACLRDCVKKMVCHRYFLDEMIFLKILQICFFRAYQNGMVSCQMLVFHIHGTLRKNGSVKMSHHGGRQAFHCVC